MALHTQTQTRTHANKRNNCAFAHSKVAACARAVCQSLLTLVCLLIPVYITHRLLR